MRRSDHSDDRSSRFGLYGVQDAFPASVRSPLPENPHHHCLFSSTAPDRDSDSKRFVHPRLQRIVALCGPKQLASARVPPIRGWFENPGDEREVRGLAFQDSGRREEDLPDRARAIGRSTSVSPGPGRTMLQELVAPDSPLFAGIAVPKAAGRTDAVSPEGRISCGGTTAPSW